MTVPRADAWRARGGYFSWRPSEADASSVQIFHVEIGDPNAPVLVLVHGFPTSSVDWFEVAERMSARFYVCALDFPGYGFSDKPRGWGYSLARDAELLEHYLAKVRGAEEVIMLAHDRGDSVALIHAAGQREGHSTVRLRHLFLTNGNIFLPLSNLTEAQRVMLDSSRAPALLSQLTPEMLATGMGVGTFTPPRGADSPEVQALATTFAHGDGVGVLHETIQYLVERSSDEEAWLRALASSSVPTTVIWGLNDTVSPARVAGFVWNQYLALKPGGNALYFLPDANHYLQNDRPDALVETVLHALDAAGDQTPGAIDAAPAAPVLVDRSRTRMPTAAEVLSTDRPAATP
jgi:pimeloyl-ACP methyl ester carboxylesterase